MFVSIDQFISSSSDEDSIPLVAIRKQLRDKSNPLSLPETSFRQLFRLSKQAFKYVLDEVDHHYRQSQLTSSIPNILKLAASVRFFAEGSYQRGVGQDFLVGMAQPTVSVALKETLNIMENILCPKHISFHLSDREKISNKRVFYDKLGFPGVIGFVDGTLINIISPSVDEHLFFSRKGKHSLNAMIVWDCDLRIRCIDATHGGASHDSFIWSVSEIKKYLEESWKNGDKQSWILGDSGYPLEPWLLTPYRAVSEGTPEAHFNHILSRCRNVAEKGNGVLKGRFRCLLHARELHYAPKKSIQIANVCAALHNICLDFNVGYEDYDAIPCDDDDVYSSFFDATDTDLRQIASETRDEIKEGLMNRSF